MNKKQFAIIISYIGVALSFFGLGWFFGRKFGIINIPLWQASLIIIGFILIIFSFFPINKNITKW